MCRVRPDDMIVSQGGECEGMVPKLLPPVAVSVDDEDSPSKSWSAARLPSDSPRGRLPDDLLGVDVVTSSVVWLADPPRAAVGRRHGEDMITGLVSDEGLVAVVALVLAEHGQVRCWRAGCG